ncbi:MAG: TolC family protein [Methylococcaceae bacterium]|nr:TolC family protein [Methylococcaceae bacterium]
MKRQLVTILICSPLLGLLPTESRAAPPSAEPINLLKVYQQALLEDPQLERWQANLDANREAQAQSEAKLLLPKVNANANITGNFQTINLQGNAVGQGGSSNFKSYGYSLTLTQPLFHYDRLIAVDQAGKAVKKADMQMLTAHQDLIVRVAERYFAVLGALDNLNFAKSQRETLAQQHDKIHKQFDAGGIDHHRHH